jgi:hypothetical protein
VRIHSLRGRYVPEPDANVDDDSSYFSLALALITLSPILLMVSMKSEI